MIHSVEISLKSFTCQEISHILPRLQACFPKESEFQLVHLPKTRKLFTVLRSPHIDKKARDQFYLVTYKIKCKIIPSSSLSREKVLACLEAIKHIPSAGVQIQVQLLGQTAL